MAKSRKAPSDTRQRAPKGIEPTAPFDREHTKPASREAAGIPQKGSVAGKATKPAGRPFAALASKPSSSRPGPPSRPAPTTPDARTVGAIITRRASERLRDGHLWVYATDIESLTTGTGESPSLLSVADNRGLLLGTALFSPASQIPLRLIARHAVDEQEWLSTLADRMRAAIDRRTSMLNGDTNACRLVFSEADDLPGLIVDKYAEIIIVQLLTKGLDTAATREVCARVLREHLTGAMTIWERPDPRIRELEGLSAPTTTPLFSSHAQPMAKTLFRLNGLSFHFDVGSGQKTGAFLDQRQNYAAAASWAKLRGARKALDVCTYQGGFALHLAQVCQDVTGIDASRPSLEVAEQNLAANRATIQGKVDWVEADAFELLRAWSAEHSAGGSWDLIVLDPPAFAKSKRAVEGALRGYKELNLRALRMLKPGGLLITCSCSHHVTWTDLEDAVASAAIDAHRRVTLLERRGASLDHPVVLNLPETEYLKCLICRVD